MIIPLPPSTVMLNSFQHPSCGTGIVRASCSTLQAPWILKQVQDDGIGVAPTC